MHGSASSSNEAVDNRFKAWCGMNFREWLGEGDKREGVMTCVDDLQKLGHMHASSDVRAPHRRCPCRMVGTGPVMCSVQDTAQAAGAL
jgi:hypothetical protein